MRRRDYPGWRILPAWRCPADQPSRLTPNPGTAALAVDDPGFPQDLQVADRRLGEIERRGQLADAHLAALMRTNHGRSRNRTG
jgi:hypothetical protein